MTEKITEFDKDTENTGTPLIGVEGDQLKIYLVSLGEGYGGDYDPEDPEDDSLLRLDIYTKKNGEWEQDENYGSVCTCIREEASAVALRKAARHIYHVLMMFIKDHPGASLKSMMEKLSYLSDEDFVGNGIYA